MQIRRNLKRTVIIAVTAVVTVACTLSQFVIPQKSTNSISASAYTDQYEDFLSALGKRESNNNYSARSGSYLGRWQLGTSALQDAGFMNASGGWTALAKQYGVTSAATFLSSKAAQDYAVYLVHKKIWSYLKSNGAAAYVGKTYQGLTITVSGLVGAAHLVGPYALKRAIANNSSASDSAGATAYSYMKLLGSYDITSTITGTASASVVKPTNAETTPATETTATAIQSANVENKVNSLGYDIDTVKAYGDANGDGTVESRDAVLVLLYYAETLAGDDESFEEFVSGYLGAVSKDNTEETTVTEETISETDAADISDETEEETVLADDSVSVVMNNSYAEGSEGETISAEIFEAESETEESTETTESVDVTENTETTEKEHSYLGDVNKDGVVDARDAVIILQYYAYSIVNGLDNVSAEDPTEGTTDSTEETTESYTTNLVDENETSAETAETISGE